MKINHDLRHKISVVEAQGKALIEQKVELEASAQARDQEVGALRQDVARLRERLQGDVAPEEAAAQPPSPAEVDLPTWEGVSATAFVGLLLWAKTCSIQCVGCHNTLKTEAESQHVSENHNRAAFLCQSGKGLGMVVGAEGRPGRADPSEPMLGRADAAMPPLPASLSPEGRMNEEDEDEAALIWVMRRSDSRSRVVWL